MRKKIAAALLIGAAAGLGAGLASAVGLYGSFEARSWDWRARLTAEGRGEGTQAVVVAIDQASLDSMEAAFDLGWPWPREVYGAAIEWARHCGARGVLFDMHFTEPSQYTLSDETLAEAMRALPVYVNVLEEGGEPLEPVEVIGAAAAGWTAAQAVRDMDGTVRRYRLRDEIGGRTYPSIAVAAARLLGFETEVPEEATYLPCEGAGFPVVSALDVLAAGERVMSGMEPELDSEDFRGRVILFGGTAAGLHDMVSTSLETDVPGLFIHGQALRSLLEGRWIRRTPAWVDGLLAGALAAATALLVVLLPLSRSSFLSPALVLAASIGAIEAGRFDIWLGYTYAVGAWAAAWIASAAYMYFTEGALRRRIHDTFGLYVAPAVRDKILRRPDAIKLTGERVKVSVLFMDFVGFTSIAERMPAEDLVRLVNEYHTLAADGIYEEEGTLDKFIGDAVMAFWGDPVAHGDDAVRACRAALAIRRKLLAKLRTSSGATLKACFGINTGEAIIGDMGSVRHRNYSAIGDEVNLASRLEGLNRTFGTQILVSEATRREVGDALPTREIVSVRVKGRATPVTVYEVGGPEQNDGWTRALAEFRAGRFVDARALFESRGGDTAAQFYLKWLDGLPATAPDGWTGTYDAVSK